MAQWLRLCASTAGCMGSIPDRGNKDPACCMAWAKKKKKLTVKYLPAMVPSIEGGI